MNILVTINRKYIKQLISLLYSIQKFNENEKFNIYILHKDLENEDIEQVKEFLDLDRFSIEAIKVDQADIDLFPVYEERYPVEIYFRLFATKYLPKDVDKVLYLDTDIIVINELKELYNMDFEGNYFIATTHVRKIVHKFNEIRLGIKEDEPYVNTGVLLMNLQQIRKETTYETNILNFIKNNKNKLMLPDQDVLSTLYGSKTKIVDEMKYNLGDRSLRIYNLNNPNNKINLKSICKNTVIIHYYGRNKPYNENYIGTLGCFYYKIEKELNEKKYINK